MIRASFVRLLCAGGLCLLALGLSSPSGDNSDIGAVNDHDPWHRW
jgi:hypothetical protein